MTGPVSNQYTQQIQSTYAAKIDAADDQLQQIQNRMAQLEKDPLVQRFKDDSFIGSFFGSVREYRQLRQQLPGVQEATNKAIDALKAEMNKALEAEMKGVKAVEDAKAAGAAVTANIKDMDIESAMMFVQMNRANQLEGQLKDQIAEIQNRNKAIAELNSLLAAVRNQRPSGEKDPEGDISKTLVDQLRAAGVDVGSYADDGKIKQSEFDKIIENAKGKIDSLNSTQQMDMIRLQSLTNKRNEAFEIMTNFIQKMAKTRDSIVGNMR